MHIDLAEEDNPEPLVLPEALEDVELGGACCFPLGHHLIALLLSEVLVIQLGKWLRDRIDDTAVDHVEEIHDDEALEHESLVVSTSREDAIITGVTPLHWRGEQVVLIITDDGRNIEKEDHDDELIESLEEDLAHHGLGHDFLLW